MSNGIEFLRLIERGEDVTGHLLKNNVGYGWAIEDGLITKHPAWLEFYLTQRGRDLLAAQNPHTEQRTEAGNETDAKA